MSADDHDHNVKGIICSLYRVEMPEGTHHAHGGPKASCHLHMVVFHDVGQQLPPLVAVRDCNGGDGGKPQVLHYTSQNDCGHNSATLMRNHVTITLVSCSAT